MIAVYILGGMVAAIVVVYIVSRVATIAHFRSRAEYERSINPTGENDAKRR